MTYGKLFALKHGRSNIVVDLVNYFKLEDMEIVFSDLKQPQDYDADFVKYFPLKKFPAFIIKNHSYNVHFKEDVFKMNEVVAILYCLLSRLVNNTESKRAIEAQKLLSGEIDDLQAYGSNCKWLCFTTNEFIPLMETIFKMKVTHEVQYDEVAYRELIKKAYFFMEDIIEPELRNHCFLVTNNSPSISDLFIMTPILDFFSVEYDPAWCKKHPILMDWFNETISHPMISYRLSNINMV